MDPVSITGTAAGLVSLGLQVTSGVIKYLDAIKERKEDLRVATRRATRLHGLIKAIEPVIPTLEAQHQRQIDVVGGCLADCEKELKALDDFLASIYDAQPPQQTGPGQTKSIRHTIREGKKKLTYPFDKRRIQTLERRLGDALSVLETAMAALNITATSKVQQDVSAVAVLSGTIKNTIADVDSKVEAGFARMQDQFQNQAHQVAVLPSLIARDSSAVTNAVETFRERFEVTQTAFSSQIQHNQRDGLAHLDQIQVAISSQLAGVPDAIASLVERQLAELAERRKQLAEHHKQMEETQKRTEETHKRIGEILNHLACEAEEFDPILALARMGSKPQALHAVADSLGGRDALNSAMKRSAARQRARHGGHIPTPPHAYTCRDRCTHEYRGARWGSFYFRQESVVRQRHFPHYRDASVMTMRRTYGVTYDGLARLASIAIGLTFSTTSGAGAWSIGPQLTCYRVVDEKTSPAFALTRIFDDYLSKSVGFGLKTNNKIIESYFSRLQVIYRRGGSFVTDRTESRETILCRILDVLRLFVPEFLPHLRTFITAWNHPMEAGPGNRSPICIFLDCADRYLKMSSHWLDIWESLIVLSSEVSVQVQVADHGVWKLKVHPLLPRSWTLREALCFGPVEDAIVLRDVEKLQRLTDRKWDSACCTNILRLTPFHLAAGWREGMEMALKFTPRHDIEASDVNYDTPLAYVLNLSETGCIEANGYICDGCGYCACVELLLGHGALIEGYPSGSTRVTMIVLQHLKARCLELRSYLPSGLQLGPRNSGDASVDLDIPEILALLTENDIALPPLLDLQFQNWHPVYDLFPWDLGHHESFADYAYQLGFRAVARSSRWTLFQLAWLLTHGIITGETVLHRRSYKDIGSTLRTTKFFPEDAEIIHTVLVLVVSARAEDGCKCQCTAEGCSPLTDFLEMIWNDINLEGVLPSLLETIDKEVCGFPGVPPHAIRIWAFSKLGMEHTCCKRKPLWKDRDYGVYGLDDCGSDLADDDGYDLSDDDGYDSEFEGLVEELVEAYEDSSETLMCFLEGDTSRERISAARQKREARALTEDERRRAEDIGVVWGPKPVEVPDKLHNELPDADDVDGWMRLMDAIMPEIDAE